MADQKDQQIDNDRPEEDEDYEEEGDDNDKEDQDNDKENYDEADMNTANAQTSTRSQIVVHLNKDIYEKHGKIKYILHDYDKLRMQLF